MTTILRECFFEYAGRYSGEYNLILAYVSDTNDSFVSGGSYTPSVDTIPALAESVLYSIKYGEKPLEFSIEIVNPDENIPAKQFSEIKDYIPKGFIFNQADNPNWELESDEIAITKQLKHKIIKVGEFIDVDITLTWDNDDMNTKQIKNIIEISKNNSINNTPDINSTPNNKEENEDDYDYALTKITTIQEYGRQKYLAILTGVLIIIIIGLFIIVKVVLK